MIKQIAWNTFKNTGNINTFMEFIEVENIEKLNTVLKNLRKVDSVYEVKRKKQ